LTDAISDPIESVSVDATIAVRAFEHRSAHGEILTFAAVPDGDGFRNATNAKLFYALLKQ